MCRCREHSYGLRRDEGATPTSEAGSRVELPVPLTVLTVPIHEPNYTAKCSSASYGYWSPRKFARNLDRPSKRGYATPSPCSCNGARRYPTSPYAIGHSDDVNIGDGCRGDYGHCTSGLASSYPC